MAVVSQFDDLPVTPDSVFDYTDTLRDGSVPIVIDNGNTIHASRCCTVYYCDISALCHVGLNVYGTFFI